MSSFQDLGFFVQNNFNEEAQRSYAHPYCHLHGVRVTPLGFCFRVFVNEKPLNLEKTISSVISVIVINL